MPSKRGTDKSASPSTSSSPAPEGRWAGAFTRRPGETKYWVVKSEPTVFSFDDLMRAPGKRTHWDGVRNPVAKNFLRDGMKIGDQVFFYHSNAKPQAIVGICEVIREGYPDSTALDPKDPHFDAGSKADAPTWYMVDLRAVSPLAVPVTLPAMRARKELQGMPLLKLSRLSVSPMSRQEWETILRMGSGS